MEPPFLEGVPERKVCIVGSELVENYTVSDVRGPAAQLQLACVVASVALGLSNWHCAAVEEITLRINSFIAYLSPLFCPPRCHYPPEMGLSEVLGPAELAANRAGAEGFAPGEPEQLWYVSGKRISPYISVGRTDRLLPLTFPINIVIIHKPLRSSVLVVFHLF